MNTAPYPSYRSSGSTWLGDVPTNWDVLPGRWVFSQRRDPVQDGDEQLSATQRYGVVPQREFMEREDQKVMLALGGVGNFKHVEKDDFVISLRSFQGGIEHSAFTGCVSPAYTVLRLRNAAAPHYFRYLLKSKPYIAALQSTTDSLRDGKSISFEQFGEISLPLPPLPEQAAIAAFLDRESGKIDALVEEQRRLIELLKDQRQAAITYAVTKGLDPNARIKDSGIEWLGEVPEHWEAAPIKRVSSLITSGPRGWSDMTTDQGSIFFQSQNIGLEMDIALDDCKRIAPEVNAESQRAMLQSDDVVVCITGARTGAVAHIPTLSEDAYVNQHVCLVRPRNVVGRYLAYALSSVPGQRQLQFAMYGLKLGLSLQDIRTLMVPLPPIDEQLQIVAHLDARCSSMTALVGNAEMAIGLLVERRSALIAAAVTGKIDVRDNVGKPLNIVSDVREAVCA